MAKPIEFAHTRQVGIDESVPVQWLQREYVAGAVNRTFRGAVNATRPSFSSFNHLFATIADQDLFRRGAVQGMHAYVTAGTNLSPGILVSVSGTVFFGRIAGSSIDWEVIDNTGAINAIEVTFAQAEEQVYWQNGIDFPRAWDGANIRVINGENQMPIGKLITYCHGRMVVADELNRVWVSDHFLGQGFGNRENMDNFTETNTMLGGFFQAPSNLGELNMLRVMPFADNWFAQGPLVLGYERGFCSLDLSISRDKWTDMRVTFAGAGAVGNRCHTVANSDIWYRRSDGVGTFRQGREDYSNSSATPISDEASTTFSGDTEYMRRYQPMAFFDNRVLMGVWPQHYTAEESDVENIYCETMLVSDLAKGTRSSGETGLSWEGIWTGVRPICIVTLPSGGTDRCIILSFDTDHTNRVYELLTTTTGADYANGREIPIRGWWSTSAINPDVGATFWPKKLLGNGFCLIQHRGPFSIRQGYRANTSSDWVEFLNFTVDEPCGFECNTRGYSEIKTLRQLRTSATDPMVCQEFTNIPASVGYWFDFAFSVTGDVTFVAAVQFVDILGDSSSCLSNDDATYNQRVACAYDAKIYTILP